MKKLQQVKEKIIQPYAGAKGSPEVRRRRQENPLGAGGTAGEGVRTTNWENMSPHKPNLISLSPRPISVESRTCKHRTETKEELKRAGTIPF